MRSDNLKPSDIFWNTLSSITYAAVSFLMSIVVINLCGMIEGGIFSFGFSTLAHLVFIVAYFGIRPMHIVDIRYRYSFNDYKSFGIKTSFIGIILGFIYVIYMYINGNYTFIKMIILFLLIIHGAIDGYADYYECEYQRVNKLYMGGESQFFRITFFTFALIISILFLKNLTYSIVIAIVVELIAFYIFNIKRSKNVFKNAKLNVKGDKYSILYDTIPLFLIVFLDMLAFSMTKISIDVNIGDVASGFFNIVFMPVNIIYLVINLFMKPYLTPLSNAYITSKKEYKSLLLKAVVVSLIISIVFLLGTYFLGFIYYDIIKLIIGNTYNDYSYIFTKLLFVVMIGGCFYSINTPLYYSLIIEKKQKFVLIAYAVTTILSYFISKGFVENIGIMGAGYAFLLNMFTLCAFILIVKALTL